MKKMAAVLSLLVVLSASAAAEIKQMQITIFGMD